jgi:hypothetical protein
VGVIFQPEVHDQARSDDHGCDKKQQRRSRRRAGRRKSKAATEIEQGCDGENDKWRDFEKRPQPTPDAAPVLANEALALAVEEGGDVAIQFWPKRKNAGRKSKKRDCRD